MRAAGPRCPACSASLRPVQAADAAALRCAGCGGLWLESSALAGLAAPPGEATPALPAPGPRPPAKPAARVQPDEVRYRRCPTCDDVMNRVNFARVSGVVLDVCRPHGSFLDAGELERIRAFLAADGGRRFREARALAAERARRRGRRERPVMVEPSRLPDPATWNDGALDAFSWVDVLDLLT